MELRIRKRGAIKAPPITELKHSTSCTDSTSWYYSGSFSSVPNGTKEVMVDYVVQDFAKRRKAGEFFFNPMRKDKVTVRTVGSGYSVVGIGTNKTCATTGNIRYGNYTTSDPVILPFLSVPGASWGNIDGISIPPEFTALLSSDVSRAQQLCSTEVLARRGIGDSDLWESVAEYRQVLDMINLKFVSLRNRLMQLLDAIGRGTASRKILKDVSEAYLLYRYGILPLMRDIESLRNSLTKASGKQRRTTRAKEQLHAVSTRVGSGTFGSITSAWSLETIDVVTIRCMSLDEAEMNFGSNLGFSFKGLMGLPWQLLSYSFVADWLVNMGDFIHATLPAPGYKQLGSCMVTTRVTTNTYHVSGAYINQPTIMALSQAPAGSCSIVRQSTTRGPLTAATFHRRFDFKPDQFTRVADAFGLLGNKLIKTKILVGPQPNFSAFRDKKAYEHWRDAANREARGS